MVLSESVKDSEDAVTASPPAKFMVRAVVTERNKKDLKESLVKQLDAFTDKIGRNVVLELVSTEIDPRIQVKRKQFLKNFITIMMFGAIGTLISCTIISLGLRIEALKFLEFELD